MFILALERTISVKSSSVMKLKSVYFIRNILCLDDIKEQGMKRVGTRIT